MWYILLRIPPLLLYVHVYANRSHFTGRHYCLYHGGQRHYSTNVTVVVYTHEYYYWLFTSVPKDFISQAGTRLMIYVMAGNGTTLPVLLL